MGAQVGSPISSLTQIGILPAMSNQANNSGVIFAKTKMCAFFMKGQCTKGAACTYAHNGSEQRTKPDLSRTQMCPDFLSAGSCTKGRRCKYAHSESELRVLGKGNRQHKLQ